MAEDKTLTETGETLTAGRELERRVDAVSHSQSEDIKDAERKVFAWIAKQLREVKGSAAVEFVAPVLADMVEREMQEDYYA